MLETDTRMQELRSRLAANSFETRRQEMIDHLRGRESQSRRTEERVTHQAATPTAATPEPKKTFDIKQWLLRKTLLLIAGRTGAATVSTLTLAATTVLFGLTWLWAAEAALILFLLRIGYILTRGPSPVLESTVVRKHLRRLAADETKIGIAFLAAGFILSWPLPQTAMAFFVLTNLTLQMLTLWTSGIALNRLIHEARNGGAGLLQKRALIVGTGKSARRVANMLLQSPQYDVRVTGFLDFHRTGLWSYQDTPLIGHPGLLPELIATSQVDAIFVAVEPGDFQRCRELLEVAETMGVAVFFMTEPYVPEFAQVRPTYIGGIPALLYRTVPEGRIALGFKNILDRLGALTGLILASPVMLLAAIMIKTDCPGPVLFKQTRAGVNGKPFKLLKFRTMCYDAEGRKRALLRQNEMSGPVFKIKKDPRITRVGQFLRRYSIDEIPQFINVLKGEMSLVGPRPPLPREVAGFQPWQRRKLSMKPGITCTWQVNGRNAIDFEEWMKLDLEYIDTWSLWNDTKILARTIPAVIKGTGS